MDRLPSKSVLLVTLVVAMIEGCSKKDPALSLCLIKSISTTVQGTVASTQNFTYDGNRPLSNSVNTGVSTLNATAHYASDGTVSSTDVTIDGAPTTITYSYDANKRLIGSATTSGTTASTTTYTYNAHDQLVQSNAEFTDGTNTGTFSTDYTYGDTSTKNPSSITYTYGGLSPSIQYLQYDDKINPLSQWFIPEQATNNVVRKEVDGQVTTTSYVYNELGYPTSSTGSDGTMVTYTYQCK